MRKRGRKRKVAKKYKTNGEREYWSSNMKTWCREGNIRAVVFLDQCISLSKRDEEDILTGYNTRVLFPRPDLEGFNDVEILESVLDFINKNRVLVRSGVKLIFVTCDRRFAESSGFYNLISTYKVEISLINFPRKGRRLVEYSPSLFKKIVSEIEKEQAV